MDKYGIITIALSTLVSIVSILTSVITIYINNKHQKQSKLYDKRFINYQNFYKLYAKYCITKEIDKTTLSNAIMDCLLTASNRTAAQLKDLLEKISNEKFKPLHAFDTIEYSFKYCVENMKKELNIR